MKGTCCSCQTTASTNRTVSVMTRMSAPANAMSTPMNAMSQQMNAMSTPMNAMSQPMNGMSQQMNGMSQQMNGMSQPMNAMSQPMNGMSQPMNAMSQPMNAMSQPMNGMSQPMNAMSMKSVGQGYSTNQMNQMNSMHSQLLNDTNDDSLNESQMIIEQMDEPYAVQSRMPQVSPSKQISFMERPVISRISQNMSATNQPSMRGSSCAPSNSFQRQSSIRHQRIPSSTISSRSSYQSGNLGCSCGRPTCPVAEVDGYGQERTSTALSIPSAAAGSMIEQPTRDCDGPCACTGGGGGPTPSKMFGRSGSTMGGFRKSTSVFKVLPGGYNNNDCKKPCDFVEPEAICLPCGHTFPEGPRDTTWRVKIMKDIGSQTTGFDHGIQTQTPETRIVTATKLEEILPDSMRYLYDEEGDACNCATETTTKEPVTSNCVVRRLESFGELSRTKSGCQNNLRFTTDGCKNPPHILEASTNTGAKKRQSQPSKKKCKGPCSIM